MNERLIVIGNGFDLARGLNTKYSDFFDWLDKRYETDSNELYSGLTLMSNDDRLITENLVRTKSLNFWYVYMSLLKLDDPDWNNVETKIKDVVTSIEEGNTSRTLNTSLRLYGTPETIAKSLELAFDEIIKFEQLFSKNLDEVVLGPARNFTPRIIGRSDIKSIKILNFNYTFIDDFLPDNVRNIHGSNMKSEHLIFGIDSTNIATFESSYMFTKTSRIMHSKLVESSPSIFSPNIKTVEFIGHSLNSSDYAYFQSIFDYLSIYNSDVELIFYFTSFHSGDTTIMSAYQDAIQSLLENYSQSLDNKDHGDNLITKLLLENRLKMVSLSNYV